MRIVKISYLKILFILKFSYNIKTIQRRHVDKIIIKWKKYFSSISIENKHNKQIKEN